MKKKQFLKIILLHLITLNSLYSFASLSRLETSVTDLSECTDSGGNPLSMADGYCDQQNNTPSCNYDGGDCCPCTCTENSLFDCKTSSCLLCIDPQASCSDCEDTTTKDCSNIENWDYCAYSIKQGFSCEEIEKFNISCDEAKNCNLCERSICTSVGGDLSWIADGYCDDKNNNQECNFDGGDCCPNTCKSNEYDCLKDGGECFDCKDPIASYDLWMNSICDCKSLGRFQCNNGDCINEENVCNGIKDCSENEDEAQCEYISSPINLENKYMYNDGLSIILNWEDEETSNSYNIYQWISCGDNYCHAPFEEANMCPEDCDQDNNGCSEGYVPSCNNSQRCCPEVWISDGYCDSGDGINSCNLECYDQDGGDCDLTRGETSIKQTSSQKRGSLDQWVKIGSSNEKNFTYFNVQYDLPYKIAVTKVKNLTSQLKVESKRSKPTLAELKKILKTDSLPQFNSAKKISDKNSLLKDFEWTWLWENYQNINDYIIDCDGKRFTNRKTNLLTYDCFIDNGFCIDKNNDQKIIDFLGDKVCDDGYYGINLFCEKYAYDCGDCNANVNYADNIFCDSSTIRSLTRNENYFFKLMIYSFHENKEDTIYKFETTQTQFITQDIENSKLICAELIVANHLGQESKANNQFCFINYNFHNAIRKGDYNLDNKIDILDVLTIENIILSVNSISYYKVKELDQNKDNTIDIGDITSTIKLIFQ